MRGVEIIIFTKMGDSFNSYIIGRCETPLINDYNTLADMWERILT